MICDFTQQHFHTRPLSLMFMDKLQDGRGNPLIYSASDSVHPISSYPPSLHPPNPIQPYSTSSWHVGQRRWSPFCFCGEEEPPLTLSTYLYFHNTLRPSAGRDSLICPLTATWSPPPMLLTCHFWLYGECHNSTVLDKVIYPILLLLLRGRFVTVSQTNIACVMGRMWLIWGLAITANLKYPCFSRLASAWKPSVCRTFPPSCTDLYA